MVWSSLVWLRRAVEVRRDASGAGRLVDKATGFHFELSADALDVVERFAQPGPPAGVDDELVAFSRTLEVAGLAALDDDGAARHRQAAFLRQQSADQQFERLRAQLAFAADQTHFHARLKGALSSVTGPADLARLPLMTKDDLRREFPAGVVARDVDLDARIADGTLVFATTSGTSGERLQVVSDTTVPRIPSNFEAWWALEPFSHLRRPRTAIFTTPICAGPICHLGRAPMEERTFAGINLFLNSTEDLFSLDRALVENVLDEMAQFGVDLLFVHPVYLAVLIRRAQAWGLPLPKPRVVVSCYQLLQAGCRRVIHEALGCPVIDFYSATELGGFVAGIACSHGRLHARTDQVHLEVVRGDRVVEDDGLGWLAVTTYNRVMPLVRYLPGDVGRWSDEQCPCSLGAEWPVFRVEGRARDVLVRGDSAVTPRAVDDALRDERGVDFYELEETTRGLVLRVVPAPGEAVPASLPRLDELVGEKVAVEVVQRFRPERSLKFRTIIPRGAGLPPPVQGGA
jgi:phenylacetate-CoA ligase